MVFIFAFSYEIKHVIFLYLFTIYTRTPMCVSPSHQQFSSFLEDNSPGTQWSCPVTILKGLITSQSQTHEQVKMKRTLSQPQLAEEAEARPAESSQASPDQLNSCELVQ